MLYYLPLEGYRERYTHQWSAPETGWLERNWRRYGVEYKRVEGDASSEPREVKVGVVLDAVGRSTWCFSQVAKILKMAERGEIKDSDVIYLDDFWHPGLEAIPYALTLMGVRPRIYAFLHAQSVDEFDFTFPLRHWMRPVEVGFARMLDGIFVCCPTLSDLVVFGGIAEPSKVHVTGHPFNSEEVLERFPKCYRDWHREGGRPPYAHAYNAGGRDNTVIWSSRWDAEKDPLFFLKVAEEVIMGGHVQDVRFVVCTSSAKLRSNDERLRVAAKEMCERFPNNFFVKADLTKEAYYAELCQAKVQFNCALQDFVPITLQEASVGGCFPLYPYFRSMPESLLWDPRYLYDRGDVGQAAYMLTEVLRRDDLWTHDEVMKRSWIHRRFDTSWVRMLQKMGVDGWDPGLPPALRQEAAKDPFDRDTWVK